MQFDFKRFEGIVNSIYTQSSRSWFGVDDVLKVFRYYFLKYESIFGNAHPCLKAYQIERIIDAMPMIELPEYEDYYEVSPDEYEDLIDLYFQTHYVRCDYNINHFFSGRIREIKMYEARNKI